jgi:hypothetical protein
MVERTKKTSLQAARQIADALSGSTLDQKLRF